MQAKAKERRAVRQVCTIAVRTTVEFKDTVRLQWVALVTTAYIHSARELATQARKDYGAENVEVVWSTAHMVNEAVERLNR